MLCCFFVVHIDQGSPRYSRDVVAEKASQTLEWSKVIPRTARSKNYAIPDAHVLKLTAICRELHDETSDPAEQHLYKTAVYQSVEYSVTYDGKGKLIEPNIHQEFAKLAMKSKV